MRERITTQAQLWLHDNTRKTWLVEPEPAIVLADWAAADPVLFSPLLPSAEIVNAGGWEDIEKAGYTLAGHEGSAGLLSVASHQTLHGGSAIARWDICTSCLPATLTSFKIQAWGFNAEGDGSLVLVNKYSEEFISQLADIDGLQSLTPAIEYTPDVGDVVGVSYVFTGAAADFLRLIPVTADGINEGHVLRTLNPTTPSFDFYATCTTIENVAVAIAAFSLAPVLVHVGDSLGYLQEDYQSTWCMTTPSPMLSPFNAACLPAYYLAEQFGWTYQNMSTGGATAAWVLANFEALVLDRHPAQLWLSIGLADWADIPAYIAAMTDILDLCAANSLPVIVTPVLQQAADFPGGDEYKLIIDDMNAQLQALVALYAVATWVDVRPVMHIDDPDYASGNLYYLNSNYTWDGWHLNAAGGAALGATVAGAVSLSVVENVYQNAWAGGLYSDTDFIDLQQDGTALTRVYSLAACAAAAGTCYLNRGTQTMYARGIADVSPVQSLMVLHFRQFFAIGASGSAVDECVFQPPDSPYPVPYERILESAPGFSQSLPDALFGVAVNSIGSLRLMDGRQAVGGTDGPMTNCIKNYIYFGQKCVCRVGGEDLPYSEYAEYWNGIMQSPVSADGICEIPIKDLQMRLEKKVPEATYTVAEYEHLEEAAIGKTKPLGYGPLKNIRPTLVNKTNLTFNLFGHSMGGITECRVRGIPLALGSYENSTATFIPEANTDGFVMTCDALGYTVDGVSPQHYGTISVALLRQALADAHIDLDSFAAIDVARPYACGVLILEPTKINELLLQLDETYLCFHATSRAGKVFARSFDFSGSPTIAASFVNGEDCWNLREPIDYSKIYRSIKYGYSKNQCVQADTITDVVAERQDWSWAFKFTDWIENRVAQLYGCEDTLIVDSLLAEEAGAVAMAELRSGLHIMPWLPISFDCPLRPFALNLGDFIEVSACRNAPEGLAYMVARLDEDPKTSVCSVTALAPAAGYIG